MRTLKGINAFVVPVKKKYLTNFKVFYKIKLNVLKAMMETELTASKLKLIVPMKIFAMSMLIAFTT